MSTAISPVVITGGAQRLGLAAALALHRDGHRVVITYRKHRPLLSELEQQGIDTLQADFTDEHSVLCLARELRRRFDSLRGLIHNASEWMREDDGYSDNTVMQRMLAVHVTAPFLLNQECAELLRNHGNAQGYADVIHMTDYVASYGSRNHIAYAASKAALDNLTLSFAQKFAPLVKVNSIAPALLMFKQSDDPAYREKALSRSLLRVVPGESEGVNAIRYILDSRYLTGKTIALDGGRHLAHAS